MMKVGFSRSLLPARLLVCAISTAFRSPWSAKLVGDDVHGFAFAGDTQDGAEEVFACCAIDPACSKDHVRGTGLREGVFAF